MLRFLNFIDKWGVRISTILILVIFLKTCNTNGKVESVKKQVEVLNHKVDTLNVDLRKQIKIEGLKSEKRMIQSSDRKILDVNRQTEIDKEVSQLEK